MHLQGGADRTGDLILTNAVFHAMHVILSLKLGDHEGLTLFIHGHLLKRTLLIVLLAILIQIPIHASLSPAPACCRGQSGTAWCCPAAAGGTSGPGTQLQETQFWFCVFYFISLIINIISIIGALSSAVFSLPFPLFSCCLVGGQELIESICCSVYYCPTLNGSAFKKIL